ncbi:MAG: SIMPL domain-containing protein [Suilimivivens sp.]
MMNRSIKVTGKGKISVKPDTIRLCISLQDTFREYDDTLKHSADSVELLKDMIERLGYDRTDLKTVYFNINTEYENYQDLVKSWKSRFKGYKYTHRMKLEFSTDNQKLGKILYALAHCPISPEFFIEYTVGNPETAKNELLGEAVKDSLTKANVLATAAGVKLGNIVNIDYSWGEVNFVSRPLEELSRRCYATDACESASYNIDIEPDDINITDTVTVIWSILD